MDFREIEKELLSTEPGEKVCDVIVLRRTPKRIYLSNGFIINIRDCDNFKYLDGKNIKQLLRDMEGYKLLKIHSHDF